MLGGELWSVVVVVVVSGGGGGNSSLTLLVGVYLWTLYPRTVLLVFLVGGLSQPQLGLLIFG